jgi:hypothetical protein
MKQFYRAHPLAPGFGSAVRNIAKIKNPCPFPIKKKPKMALE